MLVFPLVNPGAPRGEPQPPEGAVLALRPALRGLIARVLGQPLSHPDVDDATQEALRRIWENQGQLTPGEPLRPWAFGVAKHVALDTLRARRRAQQRQGGEDDALVVRDEAPDPERQALSEQQVAAMQRALARLPEGARRAIELFHGEGMSYPEIAKCMDIPVGTVATWITRGRKALAEACQAGGGR